MPTIQKVDVGGWSVRWNENIARTANGDGSWPNKTVSDFALERTAAHPDRVLVVDGELELTCAELTNRAKVLAQFFQTYGLKPGDVVSFQLPNWWEANVINLAASFAGLIINPIVPIFRTAEVGYILNDCGSRMIFVPGNYRNFDYAAMIRDINAASPHPVAMVVVRGEAGFGEFTFDEITAECAVAMLFPKVDPDAVKICMYTSGTTGRPKGVLHSHNTIHGENFKAAIHLRLTSEDVAFVPSPVTHVTGALYALNLPWHSDIPVVLMDTWDPEIAFDMMKRRRCTYAGGATPFLQDLVRIAGARGETLPDLRIFMTGGAGVPSVLIHEFNRVFPNAIAFRVFGATEVPSLTVAPGSKDDLPYAAETDGRIWRCDLKIVDAQTGDPLPEGQEGEILARTLNMALGYLHPDDNVAAYDEEGYFRTGDLGRIVDGRFIVITGRKKDLIIRNGENISPKEIEDVLFASPEIMEAAVVAMPSRKTGEAICAFVIPSPGARVELDDLRQAVTRAGLAKQKMPEHLVLVDELPRTASGKVRKDILREWVKKFEADRLLDRASH